MGRVGVTITLPGCSKKAVKVECRPSFESGRIRFYFYNHEPNEPPHIHVDRDRLSAKFWLDPVSLARNIGFRAHELRDRSKPITNDSWRHGMGVLALAADERVAYVNCTDDTLVVGLMDGRSISVPLAWYPRLLNATRDQRARWQVAGGGYGIHWPEIDEDLSTEGLLRGAPAPRADFEPAKCA
jgi:hypothetical protein